jgi:hypothetical protein
MRQMATSDERTIVRIWSRRVSSFRVDVMRGKLRMLAGVNKDTYQQHTHEPQTDTQPHTRTHKGTHTHEHQTQAHRHDRRNKIIA